MTFLIDVPRPAVLGAYLAILYRTGVSCPVQHDIVKLLSRLEPLRGGVE